MIGFSCRKIPLSVPSFFLEKMKTTYPFHHRSSPVHFYALTIIEIPLPKLLLHPGKNLMAGGVILLKVVDVFPLNLVLLVLSELFSLITESVLQEWVLCRWHADSSSHSFITYPFPSIQTEALAILTWSYGCLDFSSCVRWLKQSP